MSAVESSTRNSTSSSSVEPELGRTPRGSLHGARAVRQALVPGGRRAEQAARVAGAQGADDHVVHALGVLDGDETGAGPGSMPSSSAAARPSASRRSRKPGSTQARATSRAPSAGVRDTSESIPSRTSSRAMTPFSTSSASSARTRAAAGGSSPPATGAWSSWSCSWSWSLTGHPPVCRRMPGERQLACPVRGPG